MTQPTYHKLSSEAELRWIGENFCAGTIASGEWTHQAHISAAVYLIALRPDIQAELEMPRLIRKLNTTHGTANTSRSGYHHTITLAFLAAVREFMTESEGLPPHEIVNKVMNSWLGSMLWLQNYWSKELLFSSRARREWVEPDLQDWPFAPTVRGQDLTNGAQDQ